MTYTVQQLAKLSGVTVRALHHYDAIGLLQPGGRSAAGYRLYGPAELERLQQILFLRELDFPLEEISALLDSPDFNREQALTQQRELLNQRIQRLQRLLGTLERTLQAMKGEIDMSDKEKFEGFKQEMIDKNEKQFGAEARAKYGDDTVNKSNAKVMGMSSMPVWRPSPRSLTTRSRLPSPKATRPAIWRKGPASCTSNG